MDVLNGILDAAVHLLEGALSGVSGYLSGLSPLWYAACVVVFMLLVLGLFLLFQNLVGSGCRRPVFLLSSVLGTVFLLFWAVSLRELPVILSDWTVKLLALWASVTCFEATRRNLEYQWARNLVSIVVELPLLLTVLLAAFHLWDDIPNLFGWVSVADTFWNMLLCCAAIIAGYVVVSFVWDRVFVTFLLPGGSKLSLLLVTCVLFLTVYIRSLDAIEVFSGLNYLFGVVILFSGGCLAFVRSAVFLNSERCPRCHRLEAEYLGSEDGGYSHHMSYRWVHESNQRIDGHDASDVQRCDLVEEIRHHTIYRHKCCYCAETWNTSSSRRVYSNATPVKRTFKYWE